MKATKAGIWMDHHQAHLTEFTAGTMVTRVITGIAHEATDVNKGERHEHNKENRRQQQFFKQLGDEISQYKHVVLFGPTEAKEQLLHILRKDHRFDDIEIRITNTDHMTGPQEHAFVRKHFSHH